MKAFDGRQWFSFGILLIISLVVVFFTGGCSGQKRPDGMPPLYPCTIIITQDGKPLEGASVRLYSENIKFLVSGTTNASGVTVMMTHGEFKGAPAETYKVVVTKEEKEFIEPASITEARKKAKEKGEVFEEPNLPYNLFSYVEEEYTTAETTPLKITIDKGKNNLTLEAGKAIRISLGKVMPE